MIYPIALLYIVISVVWLVVAIRGRNVMALLALNAIWWLGACLSAYPVLLTWLDRGYSENWAMIGFLIGSLPYIILTGIMVGIMLLIIRKWPAEETRKVRTSSMVLLAFLAFQLVVGFWAGGYWNP